MTDEGVSVQDLQGVAQELQLIRSQLQAITAQVNEISLTIEALESQDPSRPVYRAVGISSSRSMTERLLPMSWENRCRRSRATQEGW